MDLPTMLYQGAVNNYLVVIEFNLNLSYVSAYRSVNATPPLHRPNPPALPPRNRHCSEGERELPLSASLGSSPSDHGFIVSGRIRTPSGNTPPFACILTC